MKRFMHIASVAIFLCQTIEPRVQCSGIIYKRIVVVRIVVRIVELIVHLLRLRKAKMTRIK